MVRLIPLLQILERLDVSQFETELSSNVLRSSQIFSYRSSRVLAVHDAMRRFTGFFLARPTSKIIKIIFLIAPTPSAFPIWLRKNCKFFCVLRKNPKTSTRTTLLTVLSKFFTNELHFRKLSALIDFFTPSHIVYSKSTALPLLHNLLQLLLPQRHLSPFKLETYKVYAKAS